jgi:hypothetical protein
MVLVFGLPVFAALGWVLGAPWWFYVLIPLIILPFTIICTAMGSIITLSLATWLPARRTRDVLVVLAILGFLLLYVAFRFAEPERFLQPDGFEDLEKHNETGRWSAWNRWEWPTSKSARWANCLEANSNACSLHDHWHRMLD